ncbi:endo-1,4-beta-xylanase [Methylopila turkensis]|uniref:Beta-xylanase n=1 Tax=Methylopila turkensis TaxID=1437816 RepID=A0A9W6JL51_9HYPH|nr:endo-1,4-beta-xylanase [Methylopila turkensis]GLK79117.1 beta-xylanase [Methylopila turkensis]
MRSPRLRKRPPLAPSISLASAAAQAGLIYGAAASNADLEDEVLRRALVRECGAVTPEFEMKWDAIEPAPGELRFEATDRLLDFACSHGMAFRGHTPWWHLSTPRWLDGAEAKDFAKAARSHLVAVAERYTGRIHSWDVVNEAVEPADGRPDGLRRSAFLSALGPSYVAEAFGTIAEIDQTALLVLNEMGLEYEAPAAQTKRRAVLRLLEGLVGGGAPVGCLGLQCHLSASDRPSENVEFRGFLREVRALALKVMITELDVDGAGVRGDRAVVDQAVADVYADIIETVAAEGDLVGVITWGVSDAKSWLNSRINHRPARALPLNEAGRPKPSWRALARSLENIHAAGKLT